MSQRHYATAGSRRSLSILVVLLIAGGCAVTPTPPAGNDNTGPNANVNANANTNANVNDNTAANVNDNVVANANDNVNDNTGGNDNVAPGCEKDSDCDDGQVCTEGVCEEAPIAEPRLEIGYTNSATGGYRVIGEGGIMPLFTAGQGGGHVFVTLRLTGFGPPMDGIVGAIVSQRVVLVEEGGIQVLHDFTQSGALPFRETEPGSGVYELMSRFVFLDVVPTFIDRRPLLFTFTATQFDNAAITATLEQNIIVETGAE